MPDSTQFSRRERQIMDVLYARGEATVVQITHDLPDPPTSMAVRRMLHILVEKGHLRRRIWGREVVYCPKETRRKAGTTALERVLQTFFGGSLEEAVAAHLVSRREKLSEEERARLVQLIDQTRLEGR